MCNPHPHKIGTERGEVIPPDRTNSTPNLLSYPRSSLKLETLMAELDCHRWELRLPWHIYIAGGALRRSGFTRNQNGSTNTDWTLIGRHKLLDVKGPQDTRPRKDHWRRYLQDTSSRGILNVVQQLSQLYKCSWMFDRLIGGSTKDRAISSWTLIDR